MYAPTVNKKIYNVIHKSLYLQWFMNDVLPLSDCITVENVDWQFTENCIQIWFCKEKEDNAYKI